MTSVYAAERAMEAVLEGKPPRDRDEPPRPVGWVIWPGPSRGYIVLESDLPSLADALEALWFLRAEALDLLTKTRNAPTDPRRDQARDQARDQGRNQARDRARGQGRDQRPGQH